MRQDRSNDEDDSGDDETVYKSAKNEDKSRLNVFNKKVRKILEEYSSFIGPLLQRQSDRNLPRTRFAQGISRNKTMVKACEEQGVLLIILLFLSSTAGSTILTDAKDEMKILGVDRLSNYIGTIEHMLLFEEFMKYTPGHSSDDLDLVQQFMPPLMHRLKVTVDRQSGNQMKLIKFHLLLHVVDDIRRFGTPQNYSSGPSESRHKLHSKKPSKNTQKRLETFHQQVQIRHAERVAIEHAAFDSVNSIPIVARQTMVMCDVPQGPTTISSPSFLLTKTSWKSSFSRYSTCSAVKNSNIPLAFKYALDFLQDLVGELPDDMLPLQIYSEIKQSTGQIYRASPSFRSGEEWKDWAYVSSDEDERGESTIDTSQSFSADERKFFRPARQRFAEDHMTHSRPTELFGFFLLPPHQEDISLGSDIMIPACEDEVIWCLGRSLKMNPIVDGGLQHKSSTIQYWSMTSNDFIIFPCRNIRSPCIVVPDLDCQIKKNIFSFNATGALTVLGTRNLWSRSFIQLAEDYDLNVHEDEPDIIEVKLNTFLG